jgi:hypothetical protein
LNYLKSQIYFLASATRRLLVGLFLCVYLSFIIIGLEPFDTDQFEADYRFLLLSGYGILISVVFIIYASIENSWYSRRGKVWLVSHEIVSIFIFLMLSGNVLYLYNTLVVNLRSCTLGSYLHFLCITVISMIPVFVPPLIYLRQKLGERIIPPAENSFILIGENKNEVLRMEKDKLLFVKAVENYVEVCFMDENNKVISVTFRQTLSNVYEQLPFLDQCHRSYLVNINAIKETDGNSQGAKISFMVGEKEIPLSKTYYKQIKAKLSEL